MSGSFHILKFSCSEALEKILKDFSYIKTHKDDFLIVAPPVLHPSTHPLDLDCNNLVLHYVRKLRCDFGFFWLCGS
jgi:hypothetical protein